MKLGKRPWHFGTEYNPVEVIDLGDVGTPSGILIAAMPDDMGGELFPVTQPGSPLTESGIAIRTNIKG